MHRTRGYSCCYLFQKIFYWSCPWISCWIALHKDCRDSILVMVNRFLKMTHFIACKKAKNDPSVTYLFFQKVVSLHDVPKTIILKRDVEFISKFQCHFWDKFGRQLHFNNDFHPQIYGQTEVVNRTLGNIFHCVCGDKQQNWEATLPQVEFDYNNRMNRSASRILSFKLSTRVLHAMFVIQQLCHQ